MGLRRIEVHYSFIDIVNLILILALMFRESYIKNQEFNEGINSLLGSLDNLAFSAHIVSTHMYIKMVSMV